MKIAYPLFYALCFCSLLVLSGCNLNGNNTEDYEDAALEENTPDDADEEKEKVTIKRMRPIPIPFVFKKFDLGIVICPKGKKGCHEGNQNLVFRGLPTVQTHDGMEKKSLEVYRHDDSL